MLALNNVDNTSDLNKPISTATQTALNGKANSVHTHVITDVTNLQTSLDGKANKSGDTFTGQVDFEASVTNIANAVPIEIRNIGNRTTGLSYSEYNGVGIELPFFDDLSPKYTGLGANTQKTGAIKFVYDMQDGNYDSQAGSTKMVVSVRSGAVGTTDDSTLFERLELDRYGNLDIDGAMRSQTAGSCQATSAEILAIAGSKGVVNVETVPNIPIGSLPSSSVAPAISDSLATIMGKFNTVLNRKSGVANLPSTDGPNTATWNEGWSILETVTGWTDRVVGFRFGANDNLQFGYNSTTDSALQYRHSNGTAWGTTRTVWDSVNKPLVGTVTTAGEIAYDSTQKAFAGYGESKGWVARQIYKMYGATTLTNPTASTSLFTGSSVGSKTIPNFTVPGKTYKVRCGGSFSKGTTTDLIFQTTRGTATNLGTFTANNADTVGSPLNWGMESTIIVTATNTITAHGNLGWGVNNTKGTTLWYRQASVGVDSTASSDLWVGAYFGTSNAGNSITCDYATIEEC